MFTRTQLAALHRSLGAERVLSVYIDGTATDPGNRQWRIQLDNSLTDLRGWLEGSPHAEREQFHRCVERLKASIGALPLGVGAPGWAAFITKDGVREAHHLPVPVPTLAVLSTGPCLAPYMRALKEHRPVIVAIADATKTDLYDYRMGRLESLETVRAHAVIREAPHMSAPPREGFHKGTGGPPGRDLAQRSLLTARDRMQAEAASRIVELSGGASWIVVGGIKREVTHLADRLMPAALDRVWKDHALDVHASHAEIADAARRGASALRDRFDATRLEEIVGRAAAHGLGVLGPQDARVALAAASVRELYITRAFLERHASDAEDAIRAALDQDASVEEVSGDASAVLDQHGGMAAGLRFRPATLAEPSLVESLV